MKYIFQPKKFHKGQTKTILISFSTLILVAMGSRLYYVNTTNKPSDLPIILFVANFTLLLMLLFKYFLLYKAYKKSHLIINKGYLIYKKATIRQLTSQWHYTDWAYKIYKCTTIEDFSLNDKYCLIKGDIHLKLIDSSNSILKSKKVKTLKIYNLYAHWPLLSEELRKLVTNSSEDLNLH